MSNDTILDRPIAFHREFVTLTGSVNAAIMLSQALYWSKRTPHEGGWFWKTQEEWEDETGLTRRKQESARKTLRQFPWWHEERRDIPAKLWFKLDTRQLVESLFDLRTDLDALIEQTRVDERSDLDRTKGADQTAQKRQSNTETTAETTTQTTAETTNAYLHEHEHDRLDNPDYFRMLRVLQEQWPMGVGGTQIENHWELVEKYGYAAWKTAWNNTKVSARTNQNYVGKVIATVVANGEVDERIDNIDYTKEELEDLDRQYEEARAKLMAEYGLEEEEEA